jgi:hypothetical protein
MKTYTGSGGIAPFILSLCTTWSRVLIVAPLSFYFRYSLSGWLGDTRNRFGRFGEEISISFAGIRTPFRSRCSLVTLLTTLTRTEAAGFSYKAQILQVCYVHGAHHSYAQWEGATFLIFTIITSLGGQNVIPALWVVPSENWDSSLQASHVDWGQGVQKVMLVNRWHSNIFNPLNSQFRLHNAGIYRKEMHPT